MTKDKNSKIPPPSPKGNDNKTNSYLGDVRGENLNLPTFRNPPPPPPPKKKSE